MLSYSITLPTIGPKLQPSTTVHALILANVRWLTQKVITMESRAQKHKDGQ